MKTKLSVMTALMLTLACCASCALGATANATVVAADTVKITAPFAGTLLPFDLAAGEEVTAGDMLFELDATPVYAPIDGVISAVFADPGDDASGLVSHYGSIAVIEPEYPLYIDADTDDAYDHDDNRYLHVGETLYLKCGSEKGTGVVVSVSGKKYTVEIRSGNFDLDDTVYCYRESAMPYDSKTGDGKVKRYADAAVTASGRIAAVCVKPGDAVSAGDLLFETIDAQSARDASPVICAPVSGAVTQLYVSSGAQVYRGALLCELADLTALELSAEIDELDLGRIRVGDALSFTLDAYGEEPFTGVITEIRPVGSIRQNATYFDVRITLPQGRTLLPGMNATILLGE